MKHNDRIYILHILESIFAIQTFTAKLEKEQFIENRLIQSAVVRELEIIGEATKSISVELKDKNPGVSWKDIAGMRNFLIHEYFRVDLEEVWSTVQNDLPEFRGQIQAILKEMDE